MLPNELQQLIDALPPETQSLFKAVVSFYEHHYESKIAALEGRIQDLEAQLSKDSSNSSKPPSSDMVKRPKSLRKKKGRKAGGQKGHKGSTLEMSSMPDEVIVCRVSSCACCQKDLSNTLAIDKKLRQVFDIPPIALLITQYEVEIVACTCGHINEGVFPPGVNHQVQYGPNIKGLLTYLQTYQHLPYERTIDLVSDLLNHKISAGTLYNVQQKAYDSLFYFDLKVKEIIALSAVVGFDETGFRANGKRHWLHSSSTEEYAYYSVQEKRGSNGMNQIGILPDFDGAAVHDFWKSYFDYDCQHALCNAHLLRDLKFIEEQYEQEWAIEMANLLVKLKQIKEKGIERGQSQLAENTLKKYQKIYERIVEKGMKQNPFIPPEKKQRGRPKKSPPLNLLIRLREHEQSVLMFAHDFKVPFDNNLSERDIRMMKLKQKVSGGFRSLMGAKYFARIRTYVQTARKQKVNAYDALCNLFTDGSIAYKLTHPD